MPDPASVAAAVVAHYGRARRDLPWRRTRDPYGIWVSEIMLQQTRVATVIPYWERWMQRFPTARALADAPLDDVLAHWAGLGYYSRARNLHRGARELGDGFPTTARELRSVPGIGPYTAGAIASIAFGERAPLVDGNVARVLARVFGVELDVKSSAGSKAIWALADEIMRGLAASAAPGDLNQGLMELGATVCAPRDPSCLACPLAASCVARATGRQDELPRLPAKRGAIPLLARVAIRVEQRGKILLARRRPEGLYGGLWELPQGDDLAEAARVTGLAIAASGDPYVVEQLLTHRRMRVSVVPAVARGRLTVAGDPGYDAVAWHALDAVLGGALGISTLTRTILCSTTPPPSPSSPRGSRRSSKASQRSATTPTTTTSARPPRARRRASTSSSSTTSR